MFTSDAAYLSIEHSGIMAGMRGNFPPEIALRVCETLMETGINVFEFTYNSVQPIEAMTAVKRTFGDDTCVGMGTVLNTDTAHRVLDAGTDFIVSPAFQPDVVTVVQNAGVLMGPGVLTPTEIVAAWNMGVKLVKLFPIGTLGVEHFKQIRGPLDHVKYMCNGGTHDGNVGDFIRAGAIACGLGSWLTGDGSMPVETLRLRARRLRAEVEDARAQRENTVRV
jgi:2-dehydro-3-deoxyphosphogluconate aldolase/(4S)-4-hydroxy-2-oxoglutarate aldolase